MRTTKILFVGHDFKFLTHVINYLSAIEQYEVVLHHHKGHVLQDFHGLVKECLRADVIFCEWGLGNLSWLSQNKFQDQALLTRVHLQEFVTDFLNQTKWIDVDKAVLVAPFMIQRFEKEFSNYKDKSKLIFNIIDTSLFDLKKVEGSDYNIGMLGILPMRKAPHLGVELLVELKKLDTRYELHIKSKRPEELDWLWRREEEREYYIRFFESVKRLNLQNSVIFEQHDADVPAWMQKIGFVLSPSDFESFHMAIPEGMASGAIPLIRNWEGAEMLYPSRFIFNDIKQALLIIKRYSDPVKKEKEVTFLKKFSKKHFGKDVILKQYDELIKDAVVLSDSRQTEPSLRSVLSNIFTKQENSIVDLNAEIQARNQKVDSIISIADEMKMQLAAGRDREMKKDVRLEELAKQQSLFQEKISSLKVQINDLIQKLSVQDERQKLNNESITNLKTEKDKKIQEVISVSAKLAEFTQKLNEARQLNITLEGELKDKSQNNQLLITQADKLGRESEILRHDIKIKNQRIGEIEIEFDRKIVELQEKSKMIGEKEQLVQSLSQKIKEQAQYIQYLEKSFMNKMIGIVRKRIMKI